MFDESDLRPISALQHLLFCERQCALIHLERIWLENRFTAEGQILHQRVDEVGPRIESRRDLKLCRSLELRSLRLGLFGIADVVELHRDPAGAEFPKAKGRWRPVPVEYKRGKVKNQLADQVQLCAQALCLEEMFGVHVPEGALFYGKTRRRLIVPLSADLREQTETAAVRLHQLLESGQTPHAQREKKCEQCSLLEVCLPAVVGSSLEQYFSRYFNVAEECP